MVKVKEGDDGNGGQAVVVEQASRERRRRARGATVDRRTVSRTPTTPLAFTALPARRRPRPALPFTLR